MQLAYSLFDRGEANALAEFLASEEWPFHAGRRLTPASAHARIANGEFDGNHDRTYWIVVDDERAGIVHVEDIGDGDPLFDLRLEQATEGRGWARPR